MPRTLLPDPHRPGLVGGEERLLVLVFVVVRALLAVRLGLLPGPQYRPGTSPFGPNPLVRESGPEPGSPDRLETRTDRHWDPGHPSGLGTRSGLSPASGQGGDKGGVGDDSKEKFKHSGPTGRRITTTATKNTDTMASSQRTGDSVIYGQEGQ